MSFKSLRNLVLGLMLTQSPLLTAADRCPQGQDCDCSQCDCRDGGSCDDC